VHTLAHSLRSQGQDFEVDAAPPIGVTGHVKYSAMKACDLLIYMVNEMGRINGRGNGKGIEKKP
jgi:hypothetical protein